MPGLVARGLMFSAAVVLLAACSPPLVNEAPPEVATVAVLPSLTAGQGREYVSVAWSPASTPGTGPDLPVTVPGVGCGRLRGARVAAPGIRAVRRSGWPGGRAGGRPG